MRRILFVLGLLVMFGWLINQAESQVTTKVIKGPPKLEVVAETKLIMEGICTPNFRGAEKILRGVPKEAEAWTFARGQSLLIAESGNLLLFRPPKTQGKEAWWNLSVELRDAGTKLARTIAERDLIRSRTALVDVANVCNRCHETFRIPQQIKVFGEEEK